MNINDLPTEALIRIFKYLHPREWFHAEFVCNSWSEIIRGFWKHVQEVEYESFGYTRVTFQGGSSNRLTCSDGDWRDTSALFEAILRRCGDYVHKITLHIPQDSTMVLDVKTILSIGGFCKGLKSLSLNGYVSLMAESVSLVCHDLPDLEEIFIWDESFPDESPLDMNSAVLVSDMISTCNRLRSLDVNFLFIPPPSEDSCRRLPNLQHIERIRWLFWSCLSPEYVEAFLSSIVGCRRTLKDLSFSSKLKAPLDGVRCGDHLRQLAIGDGPLETLDLGFQLHACMVEEYSHEVYYEPIESAPWTNELLPALTTFPSLRELSLRYFDLCDEAIMPALTTVCENLEILRLEDNYGVTGKLMWGLRTSLQKLRWISISQARLTHADVVEFILHCPNLDTMRFSNVESMSFKKMVLEAHAALHSCNPNYRHGKKSSAVVDNVGSLNLKLDTARSYIHDEAEELKKFHLCGLTLMPPGHSNVVIDRVCRKLDE